MVDINLFDKTKDENQDVNDYTIEISSLTYEEHFQKITYKIEYKKPIPSSSWPWSWSPFYLYIKFRNRNPFTYYANNKSHIVKEVESYFSNNQQNIPLIIGFKRDDTPDFKYYTFLFLRTIGKHYGLPPKNDFGPNHLNERLKSENQKRNKIKFLSKNGDSQNYRHYSHSTTEGFINYIFSANDDEKYVPHQVSKDKLFEKKNLKDGSIIGKLLDEINEQFFDFINIYCIETGNLVIVTEFVSDSTKIEFERKDADGYYWEKKSSKYNYKFPSQPNIKSISEESQKWITFLLDKNISYGDSIQITFENKEFIDKIYNYNIYKHTPKDEHVSKKSKLCYDSNLLKVIEDGQSNIQDKPYKVVETHCHFKNLNLHLLIKFTNNESKETYFERVNKEANEWKIVDDTSAYSRNLVDRIYQIYCKLNKSIKIKLDQRSTKKYPVEIIDNSISENPKFTPVNDLKISVTEQRDCLSDNKYKCYVHDLTQCSGDKPNLSEVAGLRIYNSDKEIKLFKDSGDKERTYLHYIPSESTDNKLYVYLSGTDNNLLLVCYNKQAYGPKNNEKKGTIWVRFKEITNCGRSGQESIKSKLEEIKNLLVTELPASHSPNGESGSRKNDESTNGHNTGINGESKTLETNSNGDTHEENSDKGHQDPKLTPNSPAEQPDDENHRSPQNTTPDSSEGNALTRFFKNLPKLAEEEPAKVYGTGSGIGAVGLASIGGFGFLIYKKCVGVSAIVATTPLM